MDGKPKGLKYIYVNIRSLYESMSELFHVVNGYDIICVGETWLSQNHTDNMINLVGYKPFRYDRQGDLNLTRTRIRSKQRVGGLLIYVCDKLAGYSTILSDITSCADTLEQL